MMISTADIDQDYRVIDVVFVTHGEKAIGFWKRELDAEGAFQTVKELLAEEARKVGADAIVGANFSTRFSSSFVELPGGHNVKFIAYGTAVKLARNY